jgi:hypothetical protein
MKKYFEEFGCAFQILGIILIIWLITRAGDILKFLDNLIK